MRIAVTSTHSPKYAPLAAVTTPNHLAYCERHGYDYVSCRTGDEEWPSCLPDDLRRLKNTIDCNDVVIKVESDVVFTNMDSGVEDKAPLIASPWGWFDIYASREPKGRAVLNVGVMVFHSVPHCQPLLERIIGDWPMWIKNHDDCYWQNHLGRMIQFQLEIARGVHLSDPRWLNATDQTGDPEWTWQPGDFVCHCGGGSVESRIERCKEAMRKAGV